MRGSRLTRARGSTDTPSGREVYFTLDQAIADIDKGEDGIVRVFAPDFFDLVIVDKRHRASASLESSWRRILEASATAHPQAPLIRFDRPYRGVQEQTA